MATQHNRGMVRRLAEAALRRGFMQAYKAIQVDPQEYLMDLRMAHNLPVQSFDGMFTVPMSKLDDIAEDTLRGSMKLAAAQGAGFGLGGVLTILPDLGLLAAITTRMIQKLSLIYGFEFKSDDEQAELWTAAASAAGVDISRELLERQVVTRFVPAVIRRIAVSASAEVVEKWAARLIPIASSAIGAGLNYYFVRVWGERATKHFRERHIARREQVLRLEAESAGPVLEAE
jgi:uncharacterized protein (DUF697 family)